METGGIRLSDTNYQCIGCGVMIQTQTPEAKGYLPQSALNKGIERGEFYCQRCFRLRHYNELQDVELDEDDFLAQLDQISEDDAYVIHVLDVFDIEGSIISGLPRFIGQQPFAVAVNKVDLLPKSVKLPRLRHWVEQVLHRNGLKPEEVILVSASKGHHLENLTKVIEREVHKRNVYMVGVTNVGKSTLINRLIQHYGGDKEVITTSDTPGTTLDQIQIPLTDNYSLIDTPGLIRSNQMSYYLSREEMAQVLPRKQLKPRTFQLNPEQTLFLAGLARIDFLEGAKTAFTFYVSNDLYLHRTKLEQADTIYTKHVGDMLRPPGKPEALPELISRRIRLEADQDIAISGLGWFTVNQAVELDVWLPKGVGMSIRPAML
ncbi:ribosome biogenesis GTPase YqeH [Suicoccus acidiformans]|uniref:Ribosome biogenesis GTPase YqeH n=1 Tax=Suicoccus acidiformans TaxID=2036206 RepID=A0A347WJ95_9LACT|nr:ribosome biogenesis GTPase YqeH [Suicoccus acidiformans]AXY25152.1 ribosome biogenesis GTPase YqeH [Suicoccus acidiformans]